MLHLSVAYIGQLICFIKDLMYKLKHGYSMVYPQEEGFFSFNIINSV